MTVVLVAFVASLLKTQPVAIALTLLVLLASAAVEGLLQRRANAVTPSRTQGWPP